VITTHARAHAVEIRVASSDQLQDASKNHDASRAAGGTEGCRSSGARPAVGVVPRARRGRAAADSHLLRQRPRTQPDLLASVRDQGLQRAGADAFAVVPWTGGRKAKPSKVLVTVAARHGASPTWSPRRWSSMLRKAGGRCCRPPTPWLSASTTPSSACRVRDVTPLPQKSNMRCNYCHLALRFRTSIIDSVLRALRSYYGAGQHELLPLLQSCTSRCFLCLLIG
jgi:hypothetical protein